MRAIVSIDKFVLEYMDVPLSEFFRFYLNALSKCKVKIVYGKLYCYQLHIRLEKGVYLHLFYRNFRETGALSTLRLETRPENYNQFREMLNRIRNVASRIEFVSCDVAYDVPSSVSNVFVMSKDMRRKIRGKFETTRYFGKPEQRKQDGYCRVYDKKQELWDRHGKDIDGELTRIEIVYKPAEKIALADLRRHPPEQNRQYFATVIIDWSNIKPKKVEQIRNLQEGTNIYSRYIREGVKETLANQYVLDFNWLAREQWRKLIEKPCAAVLGIA